MPLPGPWSTEKNVELIHYVIFEFNDHALKLSQTFVVHSRTQINRQAVKTDRQTYTYEYFMGSDINEHSEEANYICILS